MIDSAIHRPTTESDADSRNRQARHDCAEASAFSRLLDSVSALADKGDVDEEGRGKQSPAGQGDATNGSVQAMATDHSSPALPLRHSRHDALANDANKAGERHEESGDIRLVAAISTRHHGRTSTDAGRHAEGKHSTPAPELQFPAARDRADEGQANTAHLRRSDDVRREAPSEFAGAAQHAEASSPAFLQSQLHASPMPGSLSAPVTSATLSALLRQLSQETDALARSWAFRILNGTEGVSSLQLQLTAEGRWNVRVSMHDEAHQRSREHLKELRRCLHEGGHQIDQLELSKDFHQGVCRGSSW